MSLLNSRQENLEALALLPCHDRFQLLWSLSVILSSFRLPWPTVLNAEQGQASEFGRGPPLHRRPVS